MDRRLFIYTKDLKKVTYYDRMIIVGRAQRGQIIRERGERMMIDNKVDGPKTLQHDPTHPVEVFVFLCQSW